ncbi:hypothetical protein ACIRD3_03870 [Kitasatospora sp. NPDC093550]
MARVQLIEDDDSARAARAPGPRRREGVRPSGRCSSGGRFGAL